MSRHSQFVSRMRLVAADMISSNESCTLQQTQPKHDLICYIVNLTAQV